MAEGDLIKLLLQGRNSKNWSADARRRYLIDVEEELSETGMDTAKIQKELFEAAVTHALHHINICMKFDKQVRRDDLLPIILEVLDKKLATAGSAPRVLDAKEALTALLEISAESDPSP